MASIFFDLRRSYHEAICGNLLGHRTGSTALTNADKDSETSVAIAEEFARSIGLELCVTPKSGQTAGNLFARYTMEYLTATFARLQHLRPGAWTFSSKQGVPGIAAYDQYEHLADLASFLAAHRQLAAALGQDYLITPDIIVARQAVSDTEINNVEQLVLIDEPVGGLSPLRQANFAKARFTLHASISCKWTMRSDRAQNTRTEALNLIRNRKGKCPHIVAVTAEPLPSRLASIAMGTGDVDCAYHIALPELISAVKAVSSDAQYEILETLFEGRRIRDISDLPLDLAL